MGILYGILALIFIIFVLALTFYMYYKIRGKMYHKFLPELIIIGLAFLISIIMKVIILLIENSVSIDNISDTINIIIQSVYNAIGGLTFEGLSDINEVNSWVLKFLYYGSSLYAGIVVLFIISAKASYEFFCSVVLRFQSRNKDVYIFTCLTNNTLDLAKDIKSKYSERNTSEKRSNDCLIIFSSHSIAPFDRLDDNCREAMANGFLYLSYPHTNKTITKKLHIRENKNRRIVIFAYSSKDNFPIEEENMDIVFDDISARIKKHDKHEIEYFILTKRRINYQAYQCKYDEYKSYYKEYMKRFSISEFSPSETIDFSKQRKIMKRIRMYSQLSFNDIKVIKKYIKNQIKWHNLGKELEDLKKACDEKCKELEKEIKDLKKSNDKKCEGLEKEIKKYEYLISANSGNIHTIFKDFNFDKIFNSRFILNVWNEAKSTANQTIDTILDYDFAERFVINNDSLNVWTIGFGGTAVSITDELFINSSYLMKIESNKKEKKEKELTFINKDGNNEKQIIKEKISKLNNISFKSKDYFVNVFDPNSKDLSGLYAAEHKSYTCIDNNSTDETYNKLFTKLCNEIKEININNTAEKEKFDEKEITLIKRYFKNVAYPIYLRSINRKNIDLEIPLPIYSFNDLSATSSEFYNLLDDNMIFFEKETLNKFKSLIKDLELKELFDSPLLGEIKDTPNVFVIATGDDYRNVVISNSIVNIYAKKYELSNEKQKFKDEKVYLIINLFDKHNNNLLNNFGCKWTKNHTVLELDYMTIFIVGNSDIIYNYSNTLDNKGAEDYHFIYKTINNNVFGIPDSNYGNIGFALKTLAYNSTILKDGIDYFEIINKIINSNSETSLDSRIKELLHTFTENLLNISHLNLEPFSSNDEQNDFRETIINEFNSDNRLANLQGNFKELTLWKKESNKSAALYGDVFIKIFNKEIKDFTNENLIKLFAYLSAIEHNRWNRLHISDGWDLIKNGRDISEFDNNKDTMKNYYASLKLHNSILTFDEVGDNAILYDTYNVLYGLLRKVLKDN